MELKLLFLCWGFFLGGGARKIFFWSVMIEYGLQVSKNVSKEKSGTPVKLLSIQIKKLDTSI